MDERELEQLVMEQQGRRARALASRVEAMGCQDGLGEALVAALRVMRLAQTFPPTNGYALEERVLSAIEDVLDDPNVLGERSCS